MMECSDGIGADLAAALDGVPTAIAVLMGPEHRLAYANAAGRAVLAGGTAPGEPCPHALPEAATADPRAALAEVLATGRSQTFSARPLGLAGEFDLALSPVHDAEGRVAGVTVTAVEISHHLRASDAQLRLGEARLRLAVEATRLGTWEWVVGTDDAVWSPRQREIYGMTPDQPASYQFWHDALLPEERDAVVAAVGATTDPAGDGSLHIEHRIRRPDGGMRWIVGRGRMLFEDTPEGRRPARLIGTIEDITERKAAEAALADSVRTMGLLMQEMNHRIKNSLQLVVGILELQARSTADSAVRQTLADAASRVQAIAAVHSRLYRDTDVATVEMAEYLHGLCAELHRSAAPDGIRLAVEAEPLPLPTDQVVPLAIVVNELVTNALKYAFAGQAEGTLRIGLVRVGEGVELTVADDGAGLPEAALGPERGGSLGLMLVRTLCRQIGAVLSVERPGRGTLFRIALPCPPA